MIIDFRVRPPVKSFLSLILYANPRRTADKAAAKGVEPPASLVECSMELFLKEMDEAGVTMGVLIGRQASPPWGDVSNDDIAEIIQQYPGKFVGIGSVNPLNMDEAIAECDRAVLKLGLKGIALDPGMLAPPLYLSDRRLYPVYRRCQELGVPVALMSGGTAGPDLSYSSPVWIDQVAAEFPRLKIVAVHGCWPWVTQILGVAYRRPNVYLLPDSYMVNMPGALDYVQAANYYMEDRFLFGSAYPVLPMKGAVETHMSLPFTPKARDKALYQNAARLLNLD